MPHSTMLRLIAITSMLTALTACVGQNESASTQNSETGIGVLGSGANSGSTNNSTNETPVVQGISQIPAVTQNSNPTPAESVSEPTTQPVSDPASQPVNEPATQPVNDPVSQSVSEPATQPVSDPVSQPVSEPTTQPVSDPVTNADNATLTLTWQPSSDNTLDGYVVAYGATPDTATQQISDIKAFSGGFDFAAPSLQYSSWYDLGLHPGDNVCFKVRAYNADGLSDWSDAICNMIPQTSA